jgi:hypothetical protein
MIVVVGENGAIGRKGRLIWKNWLNCWKRMMMWRKFGRRWSDRVYYKLSYESRRTERAVA